MIRLRSPSRDRIKEKMQLLRLERFTQQRSMSTTRRLHEDLPLSIGLRASKDGINGQSLTARITPPLRVRLQKHGAKCLAPSAPRSYWQSRSEERRVGKECSAWWAAE